MRYQKKENSNSQNLLSANYLTQDGHGGRAEEHREEMRIIAREVFEEERTRTMEEMQEKILQAQYQAYSQALQDVMNVLEYDIQSVTQIGIDGCRDIFEGKKAQKFISDQIMKRISKELKGKQFRA